MDLKNPKPNHPMAQAAADELAAIDALTSAAPSAPLAPTSPDPDPGNAISQPRVDAPPAPPALDRDAEQRFNHAMLGRIEKQNEELRKVAEENAAQRANNEFLARRAEEATKLLEETLRRNRELEQALEIDSATKGFQSDLVDSAHFQEIFKGLAPHLKKRDDVIQQVLTRNADLEKKLDEMRGVVVQEVRALDQKWLDRSVMRQSPEIKQMLNSPQGKDFLAQRIPGSRRTRMAELQDAYRDGDDEFIRDIVADWKRLGKPQEVDADPMRTIVTETPRAATPEKPVTDDEVQAAFQKVLRGEMTRADFTKLTASQTRQIAARGGA